MTDPGTTDGTTQTEGQTARDIFPEDDGIPEVAQDDSPTMQRAEDPEPAVAANAVYCVARVQDLTLVDGSLPTVPTGTFWTEPVKWLSGQQDLDTTLNNIDDSFPKTGS